MARSGKRARPAACLPSVRDNKGETEKATFRALHKTSVFFLCSSSTLGDREREQRDFEGIVSADNKVEYSIWSQSSSRMNGVKQKKE